MPASARVSTLCAVLVLGLAAPVYGQTVTDGRVWTGFSAQGSTGTGSGARWLVDSQFRLRDGVETVDLVSLRGTLARDLPSGFSVGGGYGLAAGFASSGGTQVEHRLHQQLVWSPHLAAGSLALRTRFEERFLDGDDRAALRVRQAVRFTRPLSASGRLSLVIADEVMAHLGTTSRVRRGFDQHRLFAGVRRSVTPRTAIEIGYANQYLRTSAASSRMSHVLQAMLSVGLPAARR
jgi:hypothetical protein